MTVIVIVPTGGETHVMVTMLALAAAMIYGSADFLGGAAARKASPLAVLAITAPAGAVIMIVAALVLPGGSGHLTWDSAGWSAAGGIAGSLGLIAFYAGFAAAPMSVVAPVTALIATVLPVGVAIAEGERPTLSVTIGAVVCVAAVVCVSMERPDEQRPGRLARLHALVYAVPAGVAFGLFFLFLREAGTGGVTWPVAIARITGTVASLACCVVMRVRPLRFGNDRRVFGIALASGALDAAANVAYVMATRAGMFGLAVVLTSLYPGITVLLARYVFKERMRWIQRAGLVMAGVGVALVSV
jgi:drug/metabolite transporter (DMT)-like permease